MITPPVFIIDPGDVDMFETPEKAALYAEPWYDESGIRIYDAEGRVLSLVQNNVENKWWPRIQQTLIEKYPPETSADELFKQLTDYLESIGIQQQFENLTSVVAYMMKNHEYGT